MKAIQIIDQGIVQLIDLPLPQLERGQVLLRVHYVGFCGSDLNTFKGLNPLALMPVIPGHEIGAVIADVGADVPSNFIPGMSVTVNPYTNCGQCAACENGRPYACEFNQTLGVQRNGAMATYIAVPWEKIIGDAAISVRDFALVEPMSVGFHAVSRAAVTDSDRVLVFGCGMIGLGAIIRAVRRGATVIAVDVSDEKLRLAQKLGAQYTINSITENLEERISAITDRRGADVVIEAVGRSETYTASISAVAFTGRVVYIGYAKEKIPFDTQFFVKKELDIRGSRNATPADFKAVITYLKTGDCPIDDFITAVIPPEEAQSALEHWSKNPGDVFRILVQF
ncbi:zinc-binding alcohol dehydrogenase family protein [Sphingobacterium prati]|uniref:zinc-binding alcohol dehydrogenase family protein n=1 Tax=Sphingobacterium prati TaxID=2737006 RepID=UPI0015532951|nr:zinc-binding alcohol dehydrogenase family protein [Sphingobacterium prati]NPE49040.1 zinc-binding alcohol dehydrogenase family protein [Sphingobacterium prati]